MKLLLIAALICFTIALVDALGGGPIASAAWNVWLCGGLISVVLEWLIGDKVNANIHT